MKDEEMGKEFQPKGAGLCGELVELTESKSEECSVLRARRSWTQNGLEALKPYGKGCRPHYGTEKPLECVALGVG